MCRWRCQKWQLRFESLNKFSITTLWQLQFPVEFVLISYLFPKNHWVLTLASYPFPVRKSWARTRARARAEKMFPLANICHLELLQWLASAFLDWPLTHLNQKGMTMQNCMSSYLSFKLQPPLPPFTIFSSSPYLTVVNITTWSLCISLTSSVNHHHRHLPC